tara:strand:+ start:5640 stop:5918 length:279 start_codon:yes stop_codon:yes gene_type:complete
MPDTFLKNNLSLVISFLVAVFTAGGIYSEFMSIKNELTTVHERLDKKIIVINGLENRILKIEKQIEYERGYIDATKKGKTSLPPPFSTNKQN